MQKRIVFYTLGCKLNQYETEGIAAAFSDKDFSVSEYPEEDTGDIFIINTCTVTSKSEQKARRIIRKIARENPGKPIIVTGCYTQVDKEAVDSMAEEVIALPLSQKHILMSLPEKIASYPDEDIGPDIIRELIAKNNLQPHDHMVQKKSDIQLSYNGLSSHVSGQQSLGLSSAIMDAEYPPFDKRFSYVFSNPRFHTRAFLKIQDGCSHSCSYCRVTIARGDSVSLSPDIVLQRITELEKSGVEEIVLTGVNIAQYRHSGYDLGKLLLRIFTNTENIRIRLSSFENEAISDSFIQALEHPRLCPHFHISLQSGSERILRAMKRWYTPRDITQLAQLFRQKKEKPFVSGDVIVGFPGETDSDFADTLSLVEKLSFSDLHIFRYSQRPGTAAYNFTPQIPQRVAAEREKELRQLIKKLSQNYLESQRNTTVRIIREDDITINGKRFISGISENYLTVIIPYKESKTITATSFPVKIKATYPSMPRTVLGEIKEQ
ncbi:tRNA (N(6)-L-threonylcarbamoyladenosine(37)-C(2))-methylthiotransferase MtaB [Spirochaetia bacterium 38H-sp]|uniref:tRNA (N(6)-L-threonylcarbamoyladenosine(37)-C(2))-methylthiotransferase MtaB n=1 Tax=Rarispira pelagica TaxID=3141764 RepID=A0ABU9UDJ1_9SPIR